MAPRIPILARLRQVVSLTMAVLALAYFVAFVSRTVTRTDLSGLVTPGGVGAIILAALGSAATIPVTALAWGRLLRPWAAAPRLRDLAVILGLSQIAKYLPGNVGHHLARSALALRAGLPVRAVAGSIAGEALWTAAVAMSIGSLGIGLARSPADLLLVGIASAAVLVILAGRRRAPVVLYGLNFLLLGIALFLIARSLARPPYNSLPVFIGAFALAWVAGFVVPGAPAGLGVREGLLVALLSPILGPATMPGVLGFRIATTVGDLVAFIAASALQGRQPDGSGRLGG